MGYLGELSVEVSILSKENIQKENIPCPSCLNCLLFFTCGGNYLNGLVSPVAHVISLNLLQP